MALEKSAVIKGKLGGIWLKRTCSGPDSRLYFSFFYSLYWLIGIFLIPLPRPQQNAVSEFSVYFSFFALSVAKMRCWGARVGGRSITGSCGSVGKAAVHELNNHRFYSWFLDATCASLSTVRQWLIVTNANFFVVEKSKQYVEND